MAFDTKPDNHAERDQIVSAANTYRAGPAPDAAVLTLDDRIFAEPRRTYVETRAAYLAAAAACRTTSDAADDGDAIFDPAFRFWVRTVNDPAGKSLASELTKLMDGTTPGDLVFLPYRQELTKAKGLLRKLPENPRLKGGADELAALEAAITTFEPLVDADEAAVRTLREKGKAMIEATVVFDRAYTKLIRATRVLLGDEGTFAIFPRFVRPDPKPGEEPPR